MAAVTISLRPVAAKNKTPFLNEEGFEDQVDAGLPLHQ